MSYDAAIAEIESQRAAVLLQLDEQLRKLRQISGRLNIGDTFHHPLRSKATKCHVRGLIDDKIVARYWHRRHQDWQYEVFDQDLFGYILTKAGDQSLLR